MKRELSAEGLPPTMGPYSQAIQAGSGDILFISGQVPEDAEGNIVASGDPYQQTRQVIENLHLIMEEVGGELDDICKFTIFLTSMDYYPAVARAREELFAPPYPASTLVEVEALADPRWLVEIEAVAVL